MFRSWRSKNNQPHADNSNLGRGASRRTARRSFKPQLEALEERWVPAAVTDGYKPPIIFASPHGSPTPPSTAFTPAQILQAYCINKIVLGGLPGDGAGQTIAIVDAGDNPFFVNSTDPAFAASDLAQFDKQFGLPDPPSFLKLDQNGGMNYPPPVAGFGGEIALDVEWAHALAPKANIVLVEADDATNANLIQVAVNTAKSLPGVSVVSMSFGINGGFAGETALDPVFTTPAGHQGVTFLASTGDSGAPGGYPAESPNVVGVGGTSLFTDAAGNYGSESGWSGSGGGISQFEPLPTYQVGTVTQSRTNRTIPDVSLDADPNTGVAVYDSVDNTDGTGPWFQIGGTSFSCPAWAALIAIANQGRATFGLGSLDGPTQTLPRIYQLPRSDFHDITTGNNGFAAGPGYDLVTGIGTPIACQLVPDLAGVPTGSPDLLKVYRPFRYIIHTGDAPTAGQPASTVFRGNLTFVNFTNQDIRGTFFILIGQLPAGVTLAPNVQSQTTNNGQVLIPLPTSVAPSRTPVRVEIVFIDPKPVSISTFFEGFDVKFIFNG